MPAATYDLTGDRRIEQGQLFGPFLFTLRNRINDTWTLTINAAGTAGDVFTVDVFGANSDDPDAADAASYTVQSGDGVDEVAAGLAAAFASVDGVSALASGAVVTVIADALSTYLDIDTSSSTVPANITAANTVTVLIDLTAATIAAEVRKTYGTSTVLADWSSDITITDAVHSKFTLEVPAASTALYNWESAFWQLTVALAGQDPRRYFEGEVQNRLSLMQP